ncbi:MAG: hypothetical protein HN742_01770 [Lentisphaerae bacterium]|jgi:1,2-beta-oligoglucan phosphorylase|nr:hypothetical protein [Lentisphaerota bacterium]MBT4822990.1 hypothetical protein [Lentisphaerota bacterium]MBT5612335.1 hypothetical protein [Lentisphaerota bacterium]MBT7056639.1 hypothetical protein [Lentisphaerota bacterium]MBT7840564.1 hypothetical protein [Lentisphaerota bacterium]
MIDRKTNRDLCGLYHPPTAVESEPLHELSADSGLVVRALATGAIHSIASPDVPVTLYKGTVLEGGPTNLYLRILAGDHVVRWTALLGNPGAAVRFSSDRMTISGAFDQLTYLVTLQLTAMAGWTWMIQLRNDSDAEIACDLVYMQDVGMSNVGNEAYISQYVDHTVLEHPDHGYVLCARQNMPQPGGHPWLMLGCRPGCRSFVTDGFDFYGCEHRVTRRPAALELPVLPSVRRQYEFSACALQSERVLIGAGRDACLDFFAVFQADHPEPTSEHDLERVALEGRYPQRPCVPTEPGSTAVGNLFSEAPLFDSDDLSAEQLSTYWNEPRRHVETDGEGRLLSFFTTGNRHVVLKAKELLQERPTGALLRSGTGLVNAPGILSTTAYMRGVFASHLAVGNLSFNVGLSIRRDPLGVLLAGGIRVFVERDNAFELLGVPSAFENSLNGCRWVYCNDADTIEVRTWAAIDSHAMHVAIRSLRSRRFRIAIGVVMGPPDAEPSLTDVVEVGTRDITLRPLEGSRFGDRNPGAFVRIVPGDLSALSQLGGDELLCPDNVSHGAPCLVMETVEVDSFGLGFTGALTPTAPVPTTSELAARSASAERELARGQDAHASLMSNFDLVDGDPRIARVGTILPWFVQNAVIHMSAAHGLEQYLGAAWGTRDVCQGPTEMLLAFGRSADVREILTVVFANQHTDGGWPQWFMYDNNGDIRAGDSHGDVVFWPLRALCDYVEATGDLALLDDRLPYHDGADTLSETVFEHVSRALSNIRTAFVPDTSLVAYGHGDWNDSLQPADPALARQMVSSWTVGLCYETLTALAAVCRSAGRDASAAELSALGARVRRDFNARLVHDGVVCGFGILADDATTTPLLHPSDTRTGIHHRLLPMIRGIISGIFTPEQAQVHADLISEHLVCPDGARLMDRPPRYDGGRQHIFQRGESATFFGREIGIMYVHAHIRYAQAMACMGRADDLLTALMAMVPVEIGESVPNAVLRQSNAYFSSSDAAFTDRSQADREYGRVKDGSIPAKGGWRIYSSGPGLCVSLVLRHLLGIRRCGDRILFDPVLPKSLDGLSVDWSLAGQRVRFRYAVADRSFGPESICVNGHKLAAERAVHPYRVGGLTVGLDDVMEKLDGGQDEIVVAM